MPNPYFQFKQFTIYHDRCAMKVGTDGVLLGAWSDISEAKTVLDVGVGSGLIALMLAQRNNNLLIDAIDVDISAVGQAKENVELSPFGMQISCFNLSLQEFARQNDRKYDFIVSNPPFFKQSLKSLSQERTLARHTDNLSIEDLMAISSGLLTHKGKLSIVFPFEEKESLLVLAKLNNLFVTRITNVYPTPMSSPKRVLIEFSKIESSLIENDLIIEERRHVYSNDFRQMAKDFYLNL